MMKSNDGVWDLEHFKVTESNKYENIIDEGVRKFAEVVTPY